MSDIRISLPEDLIEPLLRKEPEAIERVIEQVRKHHYYEGRISAIFQKLTPIAEASREEPLNEELKTLYREICSELEALSASDPPEWVRFRVLSILNDLKEEETC